MLETQIQPGETVKGAVSLRRRFYSTSTVELFSNTEEIKESERVVRLRPI